MIEIWKDVIGYEGYYEVSNTGKVRSITRTKIFRGTRINLKGRILKHAADRGYFRVHLSVDNLIKAFTVHRLVAMAFTPNPLNLPCINHIDGNKLNNNDWNLEWCTFKYNSQHAVKMGLNKPRHREVIHIQSGKKYYSIIQMCKINNINYSSFMTMAYKKGGIYKGYKLL